MDRSRLDSLLDPAAYPDPTAAVQLLQTHVSYLFVTDRFVYKVKKPVNLGFLDFTTLERRLFFCTEELRLNRRLAREIYLEVVPLRTTPRGVSFCAEGEVVDYAVKMVRLPEARMMNRLLKQGAVTTKQIRRLARIIAAFHRNAATGPEISLYGAPGALRANWEENFAIVARFIGKSITLPDYLFIRRWVEEFLEQHEELFNRRVKGGFIREGDGDLHSGNICLTDPPVIFDCIEFNQRFRCLDTAADIAFLLMDLEYYRCGRLASRFVEEYCTVTGDEELRRLLPFYQIYRAFIRGEVESIAAAEPELSQGERNAANESAQRHLLLARGLILRERLPLVLFITCGLSGSGKSSVAEELSFQLGLELYSSDRIRKELAGIPLTQCFQGEYLEGIYHPGFTRSCYDRLRELASAALSWKRSVIIDATFRDPTERVRFRELAELHGARFVILAVSAPEAVILERLEQRQGRRDVISDARQEQFLRQKSEYAPPEITGEEVITVDTAQSLRHTVAALLTSLGVLPCGHNLNGSS